MKKDEFISMVVGCAFGSLFAHYIFQVPMRIAAFGFVASIVVGFVIFKLIFEE